MVATGSASCKHRARVRGHPGGGLRAGAPDPAEGELMARRRGSMGAARVAGRAGRWPWPAPPAARPRWAYRQGQDEAQEGQLGPGGGALHRALQKDPDNIGYKIALENARIQASRHALRPRRASTWPPTTWTRRRRSWRSPPSTTPATSRPPTTWPSCGRASASASREQPAVRLRASQGARAGAAVPGARALAAQHRAHHPQLPRPEPAEDLRDAGQAGGRQRAVRRGLPRQARRRWT